MHRITTRTLAIVAVLVVAVAAAIVSVAGLSRDPKDSAAREQIAPGEQQRIERDTSGRCIPDKPATQVACDPLRQGLWENRNGEFTDFLRSLRAPVDGPADIFTAHLRFRAEAGDLAVIGDLAKLIGAPDVRIVAVGLAPRHPAAEYVEIRNVGVAHARVEGMTLQADGGASIFRFAPIFSFPGTLAPGQSCRVYTRTAGQSDACAGAWEPEPAGSIWPAAGGSIVLNARLGGSPAAPDRWWYRP